MYIFVTLLLLLFFYYSLIFRCIYMLQAYRYRRVEENRDLSVFLYYRFQTNSSVALSIGSARQEIIYRSIPLANQEMWNLEIEICRARELFRVISYLEFSRTKKNTHGFFIFFSLRKNGQIKRKL